MLVQTGPEAHSISWVFPGAGEQPRRCTSTTSTAEVADGLELYLRYHVANFQHCSYSKTNQMHQCIKLFYFGMTLYMFRTVFPSIIRSSRLCIQQRAFVKQIVLSALTFYMFRTVFPSIIRSSRLYIQQPNRYYSLPASKQAAVSV